MQAIILVVMFTLGGNTPLYAVKYQTEQQCQEAMRKFNNENFRRTNQRAICIPEIK